MKCRIEKGKEIVIRVPIKYLSQALAYSPFVQSLDPENPDEKCPIITNLRKFARNTVYMLLEEDEKGETLLSECFDAAMLKVIDSGREGWDYEPKE